MQQIYFQKESKINFLGNKTPQHTKTSSADYVIN